MKSREGSLFMSCAVLVKLDATCTYTAKDLRITELEATVAAQHSYGEELVGEELVGNTAPWHHISRIRSA